MGVGLAAIKRVIARAGAGYESGGYDTGDTTLLIVDLMTHILKYASKEPSTMRDFAVEMWLHEVVTPITERSDDGTPRFQALYLTVDNQDRIKRLVPSKHGEQARRNASSATQPYEDNASFDTSGLFYTTEDGRTESEPFLVDRLFRTRHARYAAFAAILETWKKFDSDIIAPGQLLVVDLCDGNLHLAQRPTPDHHVAWTVEKAQHEHGEADLSLLFASHYLAKRWPGATHIHDTVDTDEVPLTLRHWPEIGDPSAKLRWMRRTGGNWVDMNKLFAWIDERFPTRELAMVAFLIGKSDHFNSDNWFSFLPKESSTGYRALIVFSVLSAHAAELAPILQQQDYKKFSDRVIKLVSGAYFGTIVPMNRTTRKDFYNDMGELQCASRHVRSHEQAVEDIAQRYAGKKIVPVYPDATARKKGIAEFMVAFNYWTSACSHWEAQDEPEEMEVDTTPQTKRTLSESSATDTVVHTPPTQERAKRPRVVVEVFSDEDGDDQEEKTIFYPPPADTRVPVTVDNGNTRVSLKSNGVPRTNGRDGRRRDPFLELILGPLP